ncbi:MAG: type II secretion system minor pseudopilin GspK [Nitrospiraceae bacterium]
MLHPTKKPDERGIALILALLILTILVALILDFDAEARRELRDATAFRDGLKASILARAGIQAARAVLRQDSQMEAKLQVHFDGPTDIWTFPLKDFPIGDGFVTATVEDERAKLNLNVLANMPDPQSRLPTMLRYKRLFEMIQVDPRLVDAIVDWVDPDDTPQADGAESGYYQTLRPAYRAANAPLQSLEELLLVKGMTPEALARIKKYVTVFPSQGDSKVNLNTADPLVMRALDPRISQSIAGEIVQGRPFKQMQDLDKLTSFEPIAKELRLTQAYDVKSQYFGIRGTIRVNETVRAAEAVVRRDEAKGDTTLVYFRLQ